MFISFEWKRWQKTKLLKKNCSLLILSGVKLGKVSIQNFWICILIQSWLHWSLAIYSLQQYIVLFQKFCVQSHLPVFSTQYKYQSPLYLYQILFIMMSTSLCKSSPFLLIVVVSSWEFFIISALRLGMLIDNS